MKFVQARGGNKYFFNFVVDSTKYCYVYLLKSKDKAIEKFVLYKNEVENKLNKKIKVLRSDQGGEYESPFLDVYAQHGIIHETTTPYSPQSKGLVERKNRTLHMTYGDDENHLTNTCDCGMSSQSGNSST